MSSFDKKSADTTEPATNSWFNGDETGTGNIDFEFLPQGT
jgi:hypothetical protein